MWEEMWENISENPLFIYKIQHLMRWFGTSPATTRLSQDAVLYAERHFRAGLCPDLGTQGLSISSGRNWASNVIRAERFLTRAWSSALDV